MQYRHIPKTGDRLSVLGFGCMRLPVKSGRIDEARAIAQIRLAMDHGVNYFDTAWPYHGGESEPLLGKALSGGRRDGVRIATKLPSWLIQSRAEMDVYLNAQLERLKTDRIDYYLVHSLMGPTWDRLKSLQIMEFLESARRDGRIGYAGFSFHGKLPDFKRIVDDFSGEFCQIQYNYLDQEYQAGTEGLEYAAARNLGIIIMEPLRGGNLGRPDAPPRIAEIWAKSQTLRSPAEWALRWVWNRPEVTVVLSGMNEEAQVEENVRVAEDAFPGTLADADLALIQQAACTYREIMRVPCTGCGYCMPCPSDVEIPGIFELFNKYHLFGNLKEVLMTYTVRLSGVMTGKTGYATQCVQCGECLEKCPQQIPIPDALAQVVTLFEGKDRPEIPAIFRPPSRG